MQSRCSVFVAANGRTRAAQRSFRRDAFSRRFLSTSLRGQHSLDISRERILRTCGAASRRRRHHSSLQIALELRSLHTSSPLLSSQVLSTQLQDDDDYVTRSANSHLSELLHDDMHETLDSFSDWPSLDDELGETSIWDKALGEQDEDPVVTEKRRKQATKRSAAEILSNFDPQCPPQTDSLEDLELWLECEAQRESVLKYQNVIDSARERRDYASLSSVQKQIVQWYPALKNAIEEEQKAYVLKTEKKKKDLNRYGPFLCTLQPEKLAVIVAHESIMHTLQKGENGVSLASLALRIGSAVEAEVNVQRALQKRMEESSERNKALELEGMLGDTEQGSVPLADTASLPEGDKEAIDAIPHFENWMYGPSHLQRFIEEAFSLEPSKKSRIRINHANQRARRILNSEEEWSSSDKLKLGVVLIATLLENATTTQNGRQEKAFSHEKRYVGNNKITGRIYLHEKLYKLVAQDSFVSLEANTTRYKPMILPPRDWVGPDDGGYSWLKVDLMRTHGSKLQKVRTILLRPLRACRALLSTNVYGTFIGGIVPS